jgi:hypothetical protein
MKQFIHKIASTILALIVLVSSFSFTVNKHICGGEIANTTLFVSADNCGMDMNVCENKLLAQEESKTSLKQEPCCKNISEFIQGNDNNQQAKEFQLDIPTIEFLTTFIYTYINNFQKENTLFEYVTYKPPLVFKDIQTLFQVFRI